MSRVATILAIASHTVPSPRRRPAQTLHIILQAGMFYNPDSKRNRTVVQNQISSCVGPSGQLPLCPSPRTAQAGKLQDQYTYLGLLSYPYNDANPISRTASVCYGYATYHTFATIIDPPGMWNPLNSSSSTTRCGIPEDSRLLNPAHYGRTTCAYQGGRVDSI